jgi:Fe-S oxidoreductase
VLLHADGGFPVLAGSGFAEEVSTCIGVGRCRTHELADGTVMCPSVAATGDEKDSTRGRARVLQEMASGGLVTGGWSSPEVEEALDLCMSCKGCASDCPTGVDISTYRAQVLHQRYRGRLRPLTHYTLGRLPQWTRLASRAPRLAARVTSWRWLGPVLTRLGGMDPRRSIPRFAPQTLRGWFATRRDDPSRDVGGAPRERIVLFVDTFTDAFRPEVGQAAVRVLEDAGFDVELSPPGCCAITWLSTGQLDAAARMLRATIDSLDAVSSGGAGYDTVDVDACTRAGVAVVNQAGGNSAAVAGSSKPPMPTVVLRTKRKVCSPAAPGLPCSSELTIVAGLERFSKKLPTPVRNQFGVAAL